MFENRTKGADLAKNVSYGYILMAILTAIAAMISPSNFFMSTVVFYMMMFFVIFILAIKFREHRYLWILLIICGIVTLLWSISILGILLTLLLFVSANDLRKESA